jgi:hypothetical protein
MYDGTFTGPEGIVGQLGKLGSFPEIGLIEITQEGARLPETVQSVRRSSDQRGIVAVMKGALPGLKAVNAYDFLAPFGPPVLQVASGDKKALVGAAQRGAEVRLKVSVSRINAESFNILGTLKGQDENLPPLVITTPRSGWWCCASERGGGLACWLEVIRALGEAGSRRNVFFAAFSGHELGHLGLDAFLKHRPEFAKDSFAWIHLGANIGGAQGPGARFSVSDESHEQLVTSSMHEAGAKAIVPAPHGVIVGGESLEVAHQGARVICMVGGNDHFHLESDRWPETVDVEAVAAFGNAFIDIALQLAKG